MSFTGSWRSFASLLVVLVASAAGLARDNAEVVEARLKSATEYLASDELEGRGLGSQGLDRAADYIAGEFSRLGLRTDLYDGTPFQKFTVTIRHDLGPSENNRLMLTGPADKDGKPQRVELRLGGELSTLALGGSATFDAPLVFAGYGITDKAAGSRPPEPGQLADYDDYAGLDVQGKVVVLLRHTPQFNQSRGRFPSHGTPSRHATFEAKISNAFQHGAAAVMLINSEHEVQSQRKRWQEKLAALAAAHDKFKALKDPTPEQFEKQRAEVERLADDLKRRSQDLAQGADLIPGFAEAGTSSGGRKMPVLFVRRRAIEPLIRSGLGKSLAEIEKAIDGDLVPRGGLLAGWKASGETNIVRKEAEVKNVLGILEGTGPTAHETIVVGAHYDHVGRGGPGTGSLAPGSTEIHNGADDNASGTAVLLEVARRLATSGERPPRRVMFIAFTGEERGLWGSAHYVKSPFLPLDQTVAMLNLDMVGRLKDEKLIVQGADTAKEFRPWLDELIPPLAFKASHQGGGFGPSDHASFYPHKIPVLHFYTGSHSDYHRPGDDAHKLNVGGMRRVADLVAEMTLRIAAAPSRPQYLETAGKKTNTARSGARPYFGSIPDFAETGDGYAISGVAQQGPAAAAGIKAGDVIEKIGASKVANLDDFDAALRKHKAGETIPVVLRRGKEKLTVQVKLGEPR